MNAKIKVFSIVFLVLVTTLGFIACQPSNGAPADDPDSSTETGDTGSGGKDGTSGDDTRAASETTTIRPRTSQAVPYAEVTVSIALDSRKGEPRISVDPEVAVITAHPEDPRQLSQVLWVVRCIMDGKPMVCPERVEAVVIRAKEGCPEELFGGPLKIDAREHNSIASGQARLEMVDKAHQAYLASSEEGQACDGKPLSREAQQRMEAGDYEGFAWRYDVVVTVGGEEMVLDPEVWITKEKE